MVRHFNISLSELDSLDINFIYDLMANFKREERSKEFLSMALAGVDLRKSREYQNFIREEIEPEEIDMTDMDNIKNLSLKLLKGGRNGKPDTSRTRTIK